MIRGKKTLLRAMELEDIDLLYQIENNPENWKVSNTQLPYSRYTLEQYVLSCGHQDIYTLKHMRLVICETENLNAIGCLDLFDFDPNNLRAGVGIIIQNEYREKGYAFESLQLLKDYAIHTLKIKQLYCSISPSNKESLNLFTHAGYIQCGHFKAWRQKEIEEWEDELFFQLLLK